MFEFVEKLFNELLWIMLEMSPYVLLGFLFAGILHVFFPQDKVTKYLGKRNFASVVNASILGVPLPLCSCGVIPTGISFYKNGASKGAATSFLISTPQTGVDSILVTYSMLGLPFALVRPVVAFLTGIFGGWLTNKYATTDEEKNIAPANLVWNVNQNKKNKFVEMFRYAFVDFLQDLAKWLVIGILIAALISAVIPNDFFSRYIGNEWLSMFMVLIAAVPLYVCATGSVPIAAVLLMKGLSPGAALVFLMAGPATNAATITVISKALGRKTVIMYLAAIISGAMLSGFIINEFLPREWFTICHIDHSGMGHESHEILPYWFKVFSAVLLTGLLINGFIRKYFKKPEARIIQSQTETSNNQVIEDMKEITISVNGMECNHCKANVERNVATIKGIAQINADIVKQQVTLKLNEEINLDEVEKMINSLGYKYGGEIK